MLGDVLRDAPIGIRLLPDWNALKLNTLARYRLDGAGFVDTETIVRKDGLPLDRMVYHLGTVGGATPLYRVGDKTIVALSNLIHHEIRRNARRAQAAKWRQRVKNGLRRLGRALRRAS